jgi:4-amino-4-deoxy-L-arabinose transferase-like glycosyltransferase
MRPEASLPWARWERVLLALFPVVFFAFGLSAQASMSATWDEPLHLTAGHAILTSGDYRYDPEHPPLARAWAALPLAFLDVPPADARQVDGQAMKPWLGAEQWVAAHQFLYGRAGVPPRLTPSRAAALLPGILLGFLVYAWARRLHGAGPAAAALGLYTFDPNLVGNAVLVTTDFPVTVFFAGTLFCLWRACVDPRPVHLAAVAVACALANVTKFSAALLFPVIGLLLAVAVAQRTLRVRDAVGLLVACVVTTWVTVWAAYGFRFAPSDTPGWLFSPEQLPVPTLAGSALEAAVRWSDAHHLFPNAWSEGFLLGQARAVQRSAYLLGEVSHEGRWAYFPVAVLTKTPTATLLLVLFGVGLALRRLLVPSPATGAERAMPPELFLLLPLAAWAVAAMSANLNIGIRHILPGYPLALVLAAGALRAMLDTGERAARPLAAALVAGTAFEVGLVHPHLLAFFNRVSGGPEHGRDYLVDSNLDWGQDLPGLAAWMQKNGVEHVNLAYFGSADPRAHGILCTWLPGSPFFAGVPEAPRLPGYVAVSETILTGVYWGEGLRAFYAPLAEREPEVVIGHSIRVYRVETPWW